MAFAGGGFLLATTGPAGGAFLSGGNDAGGPQHKIRRPVGVVQFSEQRLQPSLVRRKGHQGLDGWYLIHQRREEDGPSCDRGGISVRRRAGNVGAQHQLRTATTTDSVIRATATAAAAPAPAAAVNAVSELIAASRRRSAATANGATADIRPYPLEDGTGLRCANESSLRQAGSAGFLAASTKRPGAPPQRRTPVDDEQDCDAVDGDYTWSRRRRPLQQTTDA